MLGRSRKRVPQSIQEDRPVSLQLIADKLQRLVWRRSLWGIDERQAWHVVNPLRGSAGASACGSACVAKAPGSEGAGFASAAGSSAVDSRAAARGSEASSEQEAEEFAREVAQAPEVRVIERRAQGAEARRRAGAAAIKAICAAGMAAILLQTVFGLAIVRGGGMSPASGDGDVALTYRLEQAYSANDVIVYRAQSGQQLIGRVVALPGDMVEVAEDGTFKVNGNAQPSSNGQSTAPAESGPAYPLTLGEGQYFVLGDDRMQAVDSREVGAIGTNVVEGKVVALLRLRGI